MENPGFIEKDLVDARNNWEEKKPLQFEGLIYMK